MPILDEQVQSYLHDLRPARSEVMAEMEAVAERDSVPIVHWETERLLATLCRALDPTCSRWARRSATRPCTWPRRSRRGG